MSDNKGYEVEDLVQKICSRMFLADFVVKAPEYKKQDLKQTKKEACDVLVPFKDNLLVYQVKSKKESKKATEKNDVDFGKIHRKIDGAVKQFKAIKEALKHDLIQTIETSVGITIPFDCKQYKKIIGIVVLDLLGEEVFPEHERTILYNGFQFEHEIPIHVFLRDELEAIATEIDTLPDFIDYLIKREWLYRNNRLLPLTSEKDLLTLYKCKPDKLEQVLGSGFTRLMIDDSCWSGYQAESKQEIAARNNANKSSMLIDRMISWFHSSIGFNPYPEKNLTTNVSASGSIENYYAAITELASLTRMQRRMIADKLIDRMQQADQGGDRYSLMINKEDQTGVVVMAATSARTARVQFLEVLIFVAYCGFKLKKVIGIATENATVQLRSYDLLAVENADFDQYQYEEAAKKAKELFGEQYNHHETEYPHVQKASCKKKTGRNDLCPCGSGKKFKKCCL